jgi:hypothetical protein
MSKIRFDVDDLRVDSIAPDPPDATVGDVVGQDPTGQPCVTSYYYCQSGDPSPGACDVTSNYIYCNPDSTSPGMCPTDDCTQPPICPGDTDMCTDAGCETDEGETCDDISCPTTHEECIEFV